MVEAVFGEGAVGGSGGFSERLKVFGDGVEVAEEGVADVEGFEGGGAVEVFEFLGGVFGGEIGGVERGEVQSSG